VYVYLFDKLPTEGKGGADKMNGGDNDGGGVVDNKVIRVGRKGQMPFPTM
jgi:hypothetical protein